MRISILGCGWLGLPLGESLIKDGHIVKGSTTNIEKLATLRKIGIQPFLLGLNPEPQGIGWDFFLEADLLIINIPPQLEKQGAAFHPQQMRALLALLSDQPLPRILYISSTSVYPELNREMIETDVTSPSQSAAPALIEAEQLVQSINTDTVILRCGGLMGYNRIPAKYASGKQNLKTGNVPVNYVHRDDVIDIIRTIIPTNHGWNEIYNVVAPQHPL